MGKRRTSCKKATKLEWHSIQLLQRKGQQAKPARPRSKWSRERQGKAQRYSLPHCIHLSWWEYRQTSRLVWWERWGNLKAARWEVCTDKAQREAGHLLSKKWDSTLLSTWTATTFWCSYDALKTIYGPQSSGTSLLLRAHRTSLLTEKNTILVTRVEHYNSVLNRPSFINVQAIVRYLKRRSTIPCQSQP